MDLHYNKEEMSKLLDLLERQNVFLENIGCAKCNNCEATFYIFSTQEDCGYCPNCGSANIDDIIVD